MRYLSLFSGIGGLDLGLDRAGWTCAGQVEIEPFALAVLAKHWPAVKRWSDVRQLQAVDVLDAVGPVDAIVGGFPCQPWSVAGRQLGADDPRHLWPEYYRLIQGLRPRWVIGENVPGLLPRGADAVLADLEAAGYTCWPVVLGADDCGAPHRRKRVFFVAKLADADAGLRDRASEQVRAGRDAADDRRADVADAPDRRLQKPVRGMGGRSGAPCSAGHTQADGSARFGAEVGGLADANGMRGWQDRERSQLRAARAIEPSGNSGLAGQGTDGQDAQGFGSGGIELVDAGRTIGKGWSDRAGTVRQEQPQLGCAGSGVGGYHWPARPGQPQCNWEEPRTAQPAMGGAVDGVSGRLDGRRGGAWRNAALKGLGNAVVPQVAEAIGRAVLAADRG